MQSSCCIYNYYIEKQDTLNAQKVFKAYFSTGYEGNSDASSAFIAQQSHNLVQASSRLESRLALGFTKERNQLDGLERDMQRCIITTLAEHRRRLDLAATTVKYVDPSNVLKRGYSITRVNGKAIKDIAEISSGDCLESQLSGGYVKSVVIGND